MKHQNNKPSPLVSKRLVDNGNYLLQIPFWNNFFSLLISTNFNHMKDKLYDVTIYAISLLIICMQLLNMPVSTSFYWAFIFFGSFCAIVFVIILVLFILKEDPGNKKMQELSKVIKDGARVFLLKEYTVMGIFTILISILLALFINPPLFVGMSFFLGAVVSASTGYIGMMIATSANSRTTQAAQNQWSKGFMIAFSSGAVMGFSAVGVGLLGVASLILLFPSQKYVWLGFAFGASFVALFLRVGGGIFTKCADMGADLVGKIEQDIPEDDERNAAVIADNVGDNVGDIAGMGSDLFETYVSEIIATIVLAMIALPSNNTAIFLPLVLGSVGIFTSIIGFTVVKPKTTAKTYEQQVSDAHKAMNKGVLVSNLLVLILNLIITLVFFKDDLLFGLKIYGAIISGLFAGIIVSFSVEYYTSSHYNPTRNLARSSRSGAAITIIEGISMGKLSTVVPIIAVAIASIISFILAGLMGIAIGALGMMLNLALLLSIDCYGPIADNAAGIAEMADLGTDVRSRCEALDSVGNTTAALGKGFAITSAAFSALAWLLTYFNVVEIKINAITQPLSEVPEALSIGRIDVVIGIFIGGMLSFVLCALVMRGVSKGAFKIVQEVRRQFDEIPGIMERENSPDYIKVVDIATKQALVSLISPGVLIFIPLILGLLVGPSAVGGLLLGSLSTGFVLALMMSNAGGAWDNAKKFIEAGNLGGKGTETHIASIIGDTVGDPFKDTAGPSLDILIKLVGKVAVIFGPLFGSALLFYLF